VIDPPPSLSDRIADTEIESLRHSVTAPYMKGQPDRKGNISFDFYGREMMLERSTYYVNSFGEISP
jgi:hypothetical protein